MNNGFGEEIDFAQWIALPAAQTTVLTVNNRLSRTLTSRYARALRERSGALPAILPWSAWVTQVAFDLTFTMTAIQADDPQHDLDPVISRMLWASIIEQSREQDEMQGLIDVEQLASLAQQADEIALHWNVAVDPAWVTPEYQQFAVWQQEYEARLQTLQAIDRTRLLLRLVAWVEQGRIALPEILVLAGFAQHSPAMQALWRACAERGVRVCHYVEHRLENQAQSRASSPPAAQKVSAADAKAEWDLALAWASEQLKQHPQRRYAIVVPDLQAQSAKARRLLQRALGDAYNVAVAPALSDWPAARAMLVWMQLVGQICLQGQVSTALAGQALMIGHCAADLPERDLRTAIDVQWRQAQRLSLRADDWMQVLETLPGLQAAWHAATVSWETLTSSHPLRWEAWADLIRSTLGTLGYPGDQARTSVGFQAMQAVDALLVKLATLDDFFPAPRWSEVLFRLGQLARQTSFQPQRNRNSQLDVLGLLEAEGGQWDGVWVMGLTDTVLPAAVRPNPLLPIPALVAAHAPRSNAEREFQWAQRMMNVLCELAPEVRFSWPQRDAQQSLRASPFLSAMPTIEAPLSSPTPLSPMALERWEDGPCPPLHADEHISGGVGVLDTQARNPMWAFVRYRLHVRQLEPYASVPSRSLRGTFLHAVMRAVWEHLKSWEALSSQLNNATFDAWLVKTIDRVAVLTLAEWPTALARLEQERTYALVKQWLQQELTRAPFVSVELEQAHRLQFGPLHLKLMLDRVDQDADGQWILLDYKTGMSHPEPMRDWMRPAPVDLQMLAYTRALHQAKGQWPAAIVWAQLNPRSLSFAGLACETVEIPGLKARQSMPAGQWHPQLQQWDNALESLAEAFLRGEAANISWKHDDLQYCDIPGILRLHEEASEAEDPMQGAT